MFIDGRYIKCFSPVLKGGKGELRHEEKSPKCEGNLFFF